MLSIQKYTHVTRLVGQVKHQNIVCPHTAVAPIDMHITILCRYQNHKYTYTQMPHKVIGTPGIIHACVHFHVLSYKTLFKYSHAHSSTQYMLKLCPIVKVKCMLVSTDYNPTGLTVWEFCRPRRFFLRCGIQFTGNLLK